MSKSKLSPQSQMFASLSRLIGDMRDYDSALVQIMAEQSNMTTRIIIGSIACSIDRFRDQISIIRDGDSTEVPKN